MLDMALKQTELIGKVQVPATDEKKITKQVTFAVPAMSSARESEPPDT